MFYSESSFPLLTVVIFEIYNFYSMVMGELKSSILVSLTFTWKYSFL